MQTRLSELPPCSRVNTYILARSRKKVFLPRGNPAETERKPVGILTGYETQKHFMTALNGARNSLLATARRATAISIVSLSISGGLFYFTPKLRRSSIFSPAVQSRRLSNIFRIRSGRICSKLVRQIVATNYHFQSDSVIEEGVEGFSLRKFVKRARICSIR